MPHGPSDPELIAVLQQLEQIEQEMTRLLSSCSQTAFQRHPEAGKWSAAECVEHLIRTTEAYLPVFDRAIEKGWRRGRTGRGEGAGRFGRWFVRFMEPPPKRQLSAPKIFRPELFEDVSLSPAEALQRFHDSQAALVERLDRADGLALSRIKLASPASPLLRLRLSAAFPALTAHQRRHLWQMRRILGVGETLS